MAELVSSHQVTMEEHLFICTDGTKIAGQSWTGNFAEGSDQHTGSPSKEPHRILCLHGFMDNCRSFYFMAPYLMSRLPPSSQLVAIDYPGHGLSSHTSPDKPPRLVTISDTSYYVFEVVQALKWGADCPFSFVAHSLGAAIAIFYAACFPDHVQTLVNLDGLGPEGIDDITEMAPKARKHTIERHAGNIKYLQRKRKPTIYHNLEAAVETRRRTATKSPGNQWLSENAAYEMVSRAVLEVTQAPVNPHSQPMATGAAPASDATSSYNYAVKALMTNDPERRKISRGAVQFRHDPRLVWIPLQYHSWEQAFQWFRAVQCPYYWFQAANGWPFSQTIVDQVLQLIPSAQHRILPGSHHFHADPDTADTVSQAVLEVLLASSS